MEPKRKNLSDLFIINPIISEKENIYIWISDDEEDLRNMCYILDLCVTDNIYFRGFATDRESLIGIQVLNKVVFDVNSILNDHSVVLSEDAESTFYCPVKVLHPSFDSSNIVVWGAGKNGKEISDYFSKKNIPIKYFIDSDHSKVGNEINGVKIYGIEKVDALESGVCLIEALERYTEIDSMMQNKAPEINCFLYCNRGRAFHPVELLYLREVAKNKDVYIYGQNYDAIKLSQCLHILDYDFKGFLLDEYQDNEVSAPIMRPEELLYYDNYFVIIVQDEKELAVEKLRSLGLRYSVDFSLIEIISSNLLYARKNIIDTNLGQTYKCKYGINGIEIYGNVCTDNYKIVVLGGSTTDGNLYPFPSWPKVMYDKINSSKVTVYNAGVSGYTSAQELIRLIRDVVLIKPDMIIVYDGYNDTSEINACPGKYFEFSYLKEALDFARKHMSHDWDFIAGDDGEEEQDETIPVIGNFENWLMNIEMMHAISTDRKMKFYSFMQPMLSSKRNLTKEEKGILFEVEQFQRLKNTSLMGMEFRNKIGDVEKTHDYIYDLSHIFDDVQDVYMDICHVRAGANEIIAEEILKRIELFS